MMRFPPPVDSSGDPEERNYNDDKFQFGSLATITLAHDYVCPWCWVGFFHAQRLTKEFGVTFDWRGAELVPPGMDFSPPVPKPRGAGDPPPPAGRVDRFAEAEGVVLKRPHPPFVRSHRALLGAEFAHAQNRFAAYNEAVYRAYWEQEQDISDLVVLERIAANADLDPDAFAQSIEAEQFAQNVVPFDDEAYALGIRHVPTFVFGAEERLAEANYSDLAHAVERFLFRARRLQKKTGAV